MNMSIRTMPGRRSASLLACLVLAVVLPARASSTWVGNTSPNWATAANWSPVTVPAANSYLFFGTTGTSGTALTNDLSPGTILDGLTFSSAPNAAAYIINGNSLGLAGGITNLSTSAEILSNAVTLAANGTFSSSSASLVLAGPVSGGYNLTTTGAGTVVLAGTNTYTGVTAVNAGTLSLASPAALPTNAIISFNLATAATLNLQGNTPTVNTLIFTNNNISPVITITGSAGASLTVLGANLAMTPFSSGTNLTVNLAGLTAFTYSNTGGAYTMANYYPGGNYSGAGGKVDVTLAGGTNAITAQILGVGDIGGAGGTSGNSTLKLGQVNTFTVTNFGVGDSGSRCEGTVEFAGGLISPTLTITGPPGGTNLAALVEGRHDSYQTNDHPVDLMDTTLGTLIAQLGSFYIGHSVPTSNSLNRGITMNPTFRMGAGTLTAANLAMATVDAAPNTTNYIIRITGVFSITNGGQAVITNIVMVDNNLPPSGGTANTLILSSTISLTNGATLDAASIQSGAMASPATATAQITWGQGTIGNIPGGNLSISNVNVVLAGSATSHLFDISAGQTGTVSSIFSGPGALTLNGPGIAILTATNTYAGNTTVSSGTLQFGDGVANNGSVPGNITNNAVVIFANPLAQTVTNPISGSGSFTKSAAGTLTLTVPDIGTGVTTVSGGVLALNGAGTVANSAAVVVSGGSLDASGMSGLLAVSGFVVLTDGTLVLGGVSAAVNGLSLAGSTLSLAVAAGQTNIVTGTLAGGGATNTLLVTSLAGVTYPSQLTLIKYGSLSGLVNGANVLTNLGLSLPAAGGLAGYLTNNVAKGSVDLVLTGQLSQQVVWNGQTNGVNTGNWDILTTADWVSASDGVTPCVYSNGVTVIFDDAAAGATAVTLAAVVSPASLTVTNNALTYAFGGSGAVGGLTGLTKAGAGTLTLAETGGDDFSGGITVNGGTLVLDDAGSAIAGGLAIAGGATVQLGNGDGNGTLPAGSVTDNGTLTVDETGNVNFPTAITGSGTLVNSGSGTLTLAATNTYTGVTAVNAGTLSFTSSGVLPTNTTVSFTLATLATLNLQGTAQTVNDLLFTNTTINPSITITGTSGSSLTILGANESFAPLESGSNLTVNLSGLTSFIYNNSNGVLTVANSDPSGRDAAGGTVNVTLAAGTNQITAGTINVASLGGGGQGASSACTMKLGQVNTFVTTNLGVGQNGSRSEGTLQFAAGLANPTLNVSGLGGTCGPAWLTVGSHDSYELKNHPVDLFDTTAGTLNARFYAIYIAHSMPTGGTNGRGIGMTSTFKMGAGTLTASNLMIGTIDDEPLTTNYTISITGLFSLTNGGFATITNILMADDNLVLYGSANHLTNNDTISLTNGATLDAATIQTGATASPDVVTAQIVWGDGTVGNIPGAGLSISNVNVILAGTGTGHWLNISTGQTAAVSSILSGAGALTLSGAGTAILFATNTYTGGTTVSNGTLSVNGMLAAGGGVMVLGGGTLGGVGVINDTVNVSGTIVPGSGGVGTLSTGGETWNGGGTEVFQLNNATNSAGWDALNITGALNLPATAGSPFTVQLVSLTASNTAGPVAGFAATTGQTWTLATVSGGIQNFAPGSFTVNTAGFSNAYTGTFSVGTNATSLQLIYTPPPVLGGVGDSYTNGTFSFSFSGVGGTTYHVLASTNLLLPLTNWLVLSAGTFGTNGMNYSDGAATNQQEFYRIVSP